MQDMEHAPVVVAGVSIVWLVERRGYDFIPSGTMHVGCKHGNVTVGSSDLFTLGRGYKKSSYSGSKMPVHVDETYIR